MHKGDYHTDYSKYYDKDYKQKDLAYEHIKELKQKIREESLDKQGGKNETITHSRSAYRKNRK